MPVGLFFDLQFLPTIGMASESGIIGYLNQPDPFPDPYRDGVHSSGSKEGIWSISCRCSPITPRERRPCDIRRDLFGVPNPQQPTLGSDSLG